MVKFWKTIHIFVVEAIYTTGIMAVEVEGIMNFRV